MKVKGNLYINDNIYSGGTNLSDIFAVAGSDTNTFTTGTTLIDSTVYFNRNDVLSAYTLDVSSVNSGDTFVTGSSFSNNVLTLTRNDNTVVNAVIDNFSGLTVSGDVNISGVTVSNNINSAVLSGATISGNTIFSGGTNLLDIFSTTDTDTNDYTTGTTLVGTTLYFDRTDSLSAYTADLSSIGGGGEANTASNVGGGEGVFNTKTGVDLEFKSLTSTGGTVTINSTGDTVNLESVAPTLSKTFTLQEPTATDDITIFRTDVAITIQEITTVNVGTTPSTTLIIKHDTTRSATGTNVVNSVASTNTGTGASLTIADSTIPANSWIWLETSAASGTDVYLTIDIRYTED